MTTTRAAIRRRAVLNARVHGKSRGFASADGSTALASTGGAALTIIDTVNLPPLGAATTMAKGWWAYLPTAAAADRKRIVDSYDATYQKVLHAGPAYSGATITALASALPYLILQDDPALWDSAVNEALRELLSQVQFATFTPTANSQPLYTVSAAPISVAAIVRETQVFEVDTHGSGDPAGQERWKPWADGRREWRAYSSGHDVVLDFGDPLRAPTTQDVLRLKYITQYTTPLADDTTTVDVDELWAAYATLVVMGKWLADPANPEDEWHQISQVAATEYLSMRRAILGEDAFRVVGRSAEQRGRMVVRGRAGR